MIYVSWSVAQYNLNIGCADVGKRSVSQHTGVVSADKCAVTQIRRYVGAARARRLHKVSQTFVLRNRIDLIASRAFSQLCTR